MISECHSHRQMREKMVENWPEAVTPACDLVTAATRLSDLLLANGRPVVSSHGLISAELDVLVTLRKMAPPYELTPTSLGNSTLITSGGLTKVLHQLEEKKLIVRKADSLDRRVKRVRLTPAGIAKAETALAEVLNVNALMLNQLISKQDLENFNTILMKLLAGIEAQVQR